MAQEMMQHAKDSIARAMAVRSYGPCPVAIKKCSLVSDSHGKAIVVAIKNISSKKINAVRLSWIVYNRAGKRIGSSNGMAKKVLASGKSGSYSWGVNAASGTQAKAYVYSIVYKDGTQWQSGGDPVND
jgi:hypothetical protein